MLNWFRRTVRNINQTIWVVVFGVLLVTVLALSLTREGSGTVPEVLQLTLDSISTQSNQYIPTIASQLTQTPAEAMLTGAAPTLVLLGRQEIRQYAASAQADSEHDTFDGGAIQATGLPDTEGCLDARTAWSTSQPNSVGALMLLYAQPVIPTGIMVYQNFNPGFITRITITDLYGEIHVVYQTTPQPAPQCPFVLVVPIDDADYPGGVVTVYLDQTTSAGGWNQIDAVELIGIKY